MTILGNEDHYPNEENALSTAIKGTKKKTAVSATGVGSTLDLQEDSSFMPALGKTKSKSEAAAAAKDANVASKNVTFPDDENINDRKTLNEKR